MFKQAVRDSRLFSLPPRTVAETLSSQNVPKHQVLYAPSASASRRNWGLKFPVTDAKQRTVEFREFEDNMSTNGTNAFPSFYKRVKNLETLAAPLRVPPGRLDMFTSPSSHATRAKPINSLTKSEVDELVFKAKNRDLEPAKRALSQASLRENRPRSRLDSKQIAPTSPDREISAIGATYAPPGTLFNTPRGVITRKIAYGRVFGPRVQQGAVAFGGFIASDAHLLGRLQPVEGARVQWQIPQPFISTLGSNRNGEVSVVVQNASTPSSASSLLDWSTNV